MLARKVQAWYEGSYHALNEVMQGMQQRDEFFYEQWQSRFRPYQVHSTHVFNVTTTLFRYAGVENNHDVLLSAPFVALSCFVAHHSSWGPRTMNPRQRT